jgi:PAS domain S-box-containing protein
MLFNNSTGNRKALLNKISELENRLQLTTNYLNKITEGKHDTDIVKLQSTDDETKAIQALILKTQEKLTEYSKQEQERMWMAEGMAKFMEVIQGDRTRENFYDVVLNMVIRYTGAIQGGIFMLNEQDAEDLHLELKACYAYSRKKFVEKKVGLGQGMLGQCFLEKETSVYTTVPPNYFDITSGLGEATPRYLIMVPLKYDQHVMGVIELASFHPLEKFKVEFIEKIAENLASVALNIQHSARATQLYEESQLRARKLQEQEESLRQNIEELEATQEEMKRHQQQLDQRTYLMKFIIDNIPFPIFVKDEKGRYTLVNQSEARLFNLKDSELIGKDDSYFVANEEEWKVIQQSDERVLSSDRPLELPIQHFTTAMGASYVFKTTKIPFVNNITGKKNILGVSIDLTEKLELEKKLLHERNINSTNTLINLAGRQRMISQKIAFLAEMIVRGKTEKLNDFKAQIDLFQHSLDVIKQGGLPIGISCDNPLPEADPSLLPFVQEIDTIWLPYKDAAKKILYYYKFQDSTTESAKEFEVGVSIHFIEEHAEKLLTANDDLMLACIQMNEERVSLDMA